MSDDDGRLTPETLEKVQAWFKADGRKTAPCPFCGNPTWNVGAYVVAPVTMGKDRTMKLGGQAFPQVMLISEGCGYTIFFNAVKMGLMPPAEETETAERAKG